MEPDKEEPSPSKKLCEEDLLELAKKELLRDTKCAALRAEQFGAHSWAKKTQKYVPSKRFLHHMIVNDSRFNDRKEQKSHKKREKNRHRRNYSHSRTDKNKRSSSSESDNRHRASKSKYSASNGEECEYKPKKRKHKNVKHSSSKSKHHKSKSKKRSHDD